MKHLLASNKSWLGLLRMTLGLTASILGSGCTEHNRSSSQGLLASALAGMLYNPHSFGPADRNTWDTTAVVYRDKTFRFALSAPKIKDGVTLGPDDRHELARMDYMTSAKFDNVSWDYKGVALAPSTGPAWDNKVIWTGCAVVIKDPVTGEDRLAVPYTGRSTEKSAVTQDDTLQRIGLAMYNDDKQVFEKHSTGPVLDPLAIDADGQNIAQKLGYDLTGSNDIIMAWRDPYVFTVERAGATETHMVFAAKMSAAEMQQRGLKGPANGAIGHAIAKDSSLTAWELQPLLQVPNTYTQFELPVIMEHQGKLTLFANVVEIDGVSRQHSVRAYTVTDLSSPMLPINGAAGDKVTDLHEVYGVNFYRDANGEIAMMAFHDNQNNAIDFLKQTYFQPLSWNDQGAPVIDEAVFLDAPDPRRAVAASAAEAAPSDDKADHPGADASGSDAGSSGGDSGRSGSADHAHGSR